MLRLPVTLFLLLGLLCSTQQSAIAEYNPQKLGEAIGALAMATDFLAKVGASSCSKYMIEPTTFGTLDKVVAEARPYLRQQDNAELTKWLRSDQIQEAFTQNRRVMEKILEESKKHGQNAAFVCGIVVGLGIAELRTARNRWDSAKQRFAD
jgi:hypothetical protein